MWWPQYTYRFNFLATNGGYTSTETMLEKCRRVKMILWRNFWFNSIETLSAGVQTFHRAVHHSFPIASLCSTCTLSNFH
jgi:hypothetical protein